MKVTAPSSAESFSRSGLFEKQAIAAIQRYHCGEWNPENAVNPRTANSRHETSSSKLFGRSLAAAKAAPACRSLGKPEPDIHASATVLEEGPRSPTHWASPSKPS